MTFERYTGQESDSDRQRILAQPPDILLTNSVMLELLLTRPQERTKAVGDAGSDGIASVDVVAAAIAALPLDLKDFAIDADPAPRIERGIRESLRNVVAYRLCVDLERGWRITMPNLEQTDLSATTWYDPEWPERTIYYFARSDRMVAGSVAAPRLDLSSEDLLRSHLHAIWLAASAISAHSGMWLSASSTESTCWLSGDGTSGADDPLRRRVRRGGRVNPFFRDLYRGAAADLLGIRAREHTAQVPAQVRQEREHLFRDHPEQLPMLFCRARCRSRRR